MTPATCTHPTWTCYPYPKSDIKATLTRCDGRKITDSNVGVIRICNHCHKEI